MYDEAGQLKKSTIQGKINNVDQKLETVMVAGDGSPQSSYSYTYDNNGNRVAVSESRNGGAAQRTNYAYDALNRLISITRPGSGL
ncbi:hypothetical protein MKY96_15575 [Paenibacillus sp. FSL R7-0302]|uniref:hypothetical protein n=1 Tax=Paenibacillus sp. FSL R7-0302 TaxID=2921681 RepID=UPI0030F8A976